MPECTLCGRSFETERGLRAHKGQTHNNPKPWQDKELLHELYVEERKTQEEISDELGTHQATISEWLLKFDIETRDDAKKPPEFTMQNDGYETWRHSVNGDVKRVLVHRLLAVAEYGFDDVAGKIVHHHTNIPWDNRPKNIELMTRGEHAAHHRRGLVGGVDIDSEVGDV